MSMMKRLSKNLLNFVSTSKERAIIEARLVTESNHQAAKLVGIPRRTVDRAVNRVINRAEEEGVGSSFVPESKILILDIETAPMLSYLWNLWPKGGINHQMVERPTYILSWAAKWLGLRRPCSMRCATTRTTPLEKRMTDECWRESGDCWTTQTSWLPTMGTGSTLSTSILPSLWPDCARPDRIDRLIPSRWSDVRSPLTPIDLTIFLPASSGGQRWMRGGLKRGDSVCLGIWRLGTPLYATTSKIPSTLRSFTWLSEAGIKVTLISPPILEEVERVAALRVAQRMWWSYPMPLYARTYPDLVFTNAETAGATCEDEPISLLSKIKKLFW